MKKREKKFIIGFVILLGLCLGISFNSNAQAATKKQVKNKIVTLKKDIKKLETQKKKALALEKKQKKGTTAIMGKIISRNPFIVYQSLFSDSYYWVNNSKNLDNLITMTSGYVKLSGKYKTYNGITCAVCTAVKVSNKSYDIKNKIKKKKKELSAYQNSLKEKVNLKDQFIYCDKSKKISYSWKYSGKYNSIKWKSSNTSVAKIDSKGKITAIKQGKTTITAKCSLSGNTSRCVLTVADDFDVMTDDGKIIEPDDEFLTSNPTLQLKAKFYSSETKDNFTYEVECDNNEATISNDGLLTFNKEGVVTVTVSSSYLYTTFTVEYSNNNNYDDDYNDDSDNSYDDDYYDDDTNNDYDNYWDSIYDD